MKPRHLEPWTEDDLAQLDKLMTLSGDQIGRAHAIALPAVLEDQERFLSALEQSWPSFFITFLATIAFFIGPVFP